MYRIFKKTLSAVLLLASIFVLLEGASYAHAASEGDGTYTIDYIIKKPDDESVSMANDYWEKPATVIVSSGTITVQMTINHSEWVTQFKVPDGDDYVDANVISRDSSKNTRLVQFSLASLDKPMLSQIHVTVPEIDYDHNYTIRFVFDTSTLKLINKPESNAAPEPTVEPQPTAAANSKKPNDTVKESAKPIQSAAPQTNEPSSAPTDAPQATASALPESASVPIRSTTSNTAGESSTSIVDRMDQQQGEENGASVLIGDNEGVKLDAAEADVTDVTEVTDIEGTSKPESAVDHENTIELASALDGAVAEDAATIVSASVTEDSSKRSGIIVIVFLSILLVAGAVTVLIYRKRQARAE